MHDFITILHDWHNLNYWGIGCMALLTVGLPLMHALVEARRIFKGR